MWPPNRSSTSGIAAVLGMLLFAPVGGCGAIQRQVRPGIGESAVHQSEKIWIFEASRTQSSFGRVGRCSGLPFDTVGGAWTPDSRLVQRLDPIVRRALAAANGERGSIRGSDYHIQYFGIVVEGRRLLYLNGIHQVLTTNMLREPERELADAPVVICDAGKGAFQTYFDLRTEQLGSVRFQSGYGGPSPQS